METAEACVHSEVALTVSIYVKQSAWMISHEDSIVIRAPASEVFAYVGELSAMPDWLAGLVEVRNVIGAGEGQPCEWTLALVGTKRTIDVEHILPGAVLGKLSEHLTVGRMSRDLHSSRLNAKEMLEG